MEKGRSRNSGVSGKELVPLSEIFGVIFDSLQEGIVVADSRGRMIYCNSSLQELVGLDSTKLAGIRPPFPCWPKQATNDLQYQCESCALLRNGVKVDDFNYCDLKAKRYPLRITYQSISNISGHPTAQWASVVMPKADNKLTESLDECKHKLQEIEKVLQRIANNLLESGITVGLLPKPVRPEVLQSLRLLSTREWEILRKLLSNQRVATISRALFISPNTVRNHLKSIFRKLEVHSQIELLEYLEHTSEEALGKAPKG